MPANSERPDMKRLKTSFLTLSILTFLGFSSCDSGGDSPSDDDNNNLDQTAFLGNIGENLILGGYEDFSSDAEDLDNAANSFVNTPNLDNLEILRDAWLEASLSWQRVAFYNFGPAENSAILTINFYPTNTSLIEDNIINGPGSYNLQTAGATFAKGFPALDYLLFGAADTDEGIVEKFSTSDNAKTYLTDLTANIYALADGVYNNWSPEGSNYLETFKHNKGTSSGSSLSLMVNAWSQYMEIHVRNAKIGTPNGNSVASSQRLGPFPEKAEAYYSGESLALLKEAHNALQEFYLGISHNGTDGVGIHNLLEELNAQDGTLATDYKAMFEGVTTDLNAINGTLLETIENNGEDITEIFNDYRAIIALLKVDVVSALSISITYADNDGD